jgi:hypothetical protein
MGRRKDHFSVAEQVLLEGTKKVAADVAKTMPQNTSVIDDSIKTIESGASQGQTRTLARENPFSTPSTSSSSAVSDSEHKVFNGLSDLEPSVWKSGTTDTLILFATVALVLLVFIVSYTVFSFWN